MNAPGHRRRARLAGRPARRRLRVRLPAARAHRAGRRRGARPAGPGHWARFTGVLVFGVLAGAGRPAGAAAVARRADRRLPAQRRRDRAVRDRGRRHRDRARRDRRPAGHRARRRSPCSWSATRCRRVSAAPELLPQPWGTLGQFLPIGAGGSLLRSTAFFDGAGAAGPAWVLAAYAVAGLLARPGRWRPHPPGGSRRRSRRNAWRLRSERHRLTRVPSYAETAGKGPFITARAISFTREVTPA